MKNWSLFAAGLPFIALLLLAFGLPLPASAQDNSMAAIEEVIQEAYLDGAYNERVERNVTLGFAEEFKAYYWDEIAQELRTENLEDWLHRIRQNPGSLGKEIPEQESYRHKIISSNIYRSTAQVRLRLYQGKEVLGTRYCTLFKYPEGWKIAVLVAPRNDASE